MQLKQWIKTDEGELCVENHARIGAFVYTRMSEFERKRRVNKYIPMCQQIARTHSKESLPAGLLCLNSR